MTNLLAEAVALAAQAHRGQADKVGEPYILHPLRVMFRIRDQGHRVEVQAAAVLHDVAEDTPVTLEDIAALSPEVAVLVDAVTRRPAEAYADFVRRAGANPEAGAVKIADLEDHLARPVGPAITRAGGPAQGALQEGVGGPAESEADTWAGVARPEEHLHSGDPGVRAPSGEAAALGPTDATDLIFAAVIRRARRRQFSCRGLRSASGCSPPSPAACILSGGRPGLARVLVWWRAQGPASDPAQPAAAK